MQSVRSLISWHSQPETFAKDRRVVWAGFCPSAPFLLRCQNSFHFSVALYTPTTRWRCEGVAHDWAGQLFDSLLANYSDHSIRNIDWFSVDREQTIFGRPINVFDSCPIIFDWIWNVLNWLNNTHNYLPRLQTLCMKAWSSYQDFDGR